MTAKKKIRRESRRKKMRRRRRRMRPEDDRWRKQEKKKNKKTRKEEEEVEYKNKRRRRRRRRRRRGRRSLAAGLPRRSRLGCFICITGIYRQRGPTWRQNRACPRYVISLGSPSRAMAESGDLSRDRWEEGIKRQKEEEREREGERMSNERVSRRVEEKKEGWRLELSARTVEKRTRCARRN